MNANDEGMYAFEQHPRIFCVILGVSAIKAVCQAINQETEKADPSGSAFPAFASVISCSLQMPPGAADWEWQLMGFWV